MAATYTNNLNLAKPAYGDSADVGTINGNMDTLDTYCHDTRFMGAHAYDDQRETAYAVGEYCIYLGHYYRCTGATSGAWDSTKWVQTTIGDELEDIASGQGVSDMTGATASTAGTHGLVPAPAAGDQDKVLMGSGTWEDIPTPESDVTKTASGNPVEFDDGADAPLVKCVSAITGYQEGSGTPSPDNIRPIVAYTEVEIAETNKGAEFYNSANTIGVNNKSSVTIVSDDCFNVKTVTSGTYRASKQLLSNYNLEIGKTYTVEADAEVTSGYSLLAVRSSSDQIIKSSGPPQTSSGHLKMTFTLTSEMNFLSMFCTYNTSKAGNVTYSNIRFYEGDTYIPRTISLNGTCYDGTVDVVNGEVTTEWGMIASYAGETLPGEWISDRDEYAPGTTPTIGAQVAYELATPTTSSVTTTNLPVKSLSGYSHIESSTGDMEVEYITKAFSPITELVDSQISALQKMMELMLTSARETTMVASANYTAGTLIVACGAFYKATTAISSGASLVVGTNITPTTIAAEIAALA